MQASMTIIEASDMRRETGTRRAGRAGLAACIALIAGLGIATHLPATSHAPHAATSVSHSYIVTASPDSVIGGPGTM